VNLFRIISVLLCYLSKIWSLNNFDGLFFRIFRGLRI
jgi:hypothetical protein